MIHGKIAEWNPNIFHVLYCQIQGRSAFKDMLVSAEAAPGPGCFYWSSRLALAPRCSEVLVRGEDSQECKSLSQTTSWTQLWSAMLVSGDRGALDGVGTKEEKTVPVSGHLCVS